MKQLASNLTLFFALLSTGISVQGTPDSARVTLQPVDVKVYFTKQALLGVTATTHSLSSDILSQQQSTSLLSAVNTVPGTRMEERSPGSYRLAMRGSLIRSPFGIRNTKVYIDEFPLTDAGGNTYINLLAPIGIDAIQLIKGPDGSLFGANSGGVIQIKPKGFEQVENKKELELIAGSYGLFQQALSLRQKVTPNYQFSIDQSFLRSDGYRDNSALHRKTIQTAQQWQYRPNAELRLFALYTDMDYQTPGGLTAAQYESDPKGSRPAAGPNPGAKEQHAAIYNKTGFGGLSHRIRLVGNLSHLLAIFGSYTDFKNPFITNFERRIEKNWGMRSYLSFDGSQAYLPWQMQLGFEGIKGSSVIDNYDNNKGVAGDVQAQDAMTNAQWNVFYRAQVTLLQNWNVEASLGLNGNGIDYTRFYPVTIPAEGSIHFDKQWMPRIATSYVLNNYMSWRASIAKGYSTPTLAEVRSSDNIINTELQPESGTNYEIGYKIKNKKNSLILDVAAYTYKMDNGIVRHLHETGAEYYQNAGKMKQNGVEIAVWIAVPLLEGINMQSALSYSDYKFEDYKIGGQDYSGNRMTAVPQWVWTNAVQIRLPYRLDLNLYHNYTSTMPLDDANTVFSNKYNLVQSKVSYLIPGVYGMSLQFFCGVDNLLDQRYSLGNDINAFGGRYFNAAAARNLYGGFKLFF